MTDPQIELRPRVGRRKGLRRLGPLRVAAALVLLGGVLAAGGAPAVSAAPPSLPGGYLYPTDSTSVSVGFTNSSGCPSPANYVAGYKHLGTDFPRSVGANAYAVGPGTVVRVSTEGWGAGNVALGVQHTNSDGSTFVALYGHIRTSLGVGARVSRGQTIGTIGAYSGGPHLHLGVAPGGLPAAHLGMLACGTAGTNGFVDPIAYLRNRTPSGYNPPPSSPGENEQMLANTGFESGLSPWKRIFRTSSTNRSVYTNSARAHSGSSYLEANTSLSGGSIGQDLAVSVRAGKYYRLRIWAWSAQPASVRAHLWATGGTNESASTTVKVANRWTPIDVVLRPSRTHSGMRVELYMLSTGINFRFDSTSLRWHSTRPGTLSYNPIGTLNTLGSEEPTTVHASGWAIDNSAPTDPVAIRIYIGGPMGSEAAEMRSPGSAAGRRDDLDDRYPWAGPNHAFDFEVTTTKTGRQPVYVYAMNIGGGSSNTLLGSSMVDIVK